MEILETIIRFADQLNDVAIDPLVRPSRAQGRTHAETRPQGYARRGLSVSGKWAMSFVSVQSFVMPTPLM